MNDRRPATARTASPRVILGAGVVVEEPAHAVGFEEVASRVVDHRRTLELVVGDGIHEQLETWRRQPLFAGNQTHDRRADCRPRCHRRARCAAGSPPSSPAFSVTHVHAATQSSTAAGNLSRARGGSRPRRRSRRRRCTAAGRCSRDVSSRADHPTAAVEPDEDWQLAGAARPVDTHGDTPAGGRGRRRCAPACRASVPVSKCPSRRAPLSGVLSPEKPFGYGSPIKAMSTSACGCRGIVTSSRSVPRRARGTRARDARAHASPTALISANVRPSPSVGTNTRVVAEAVLARRRGRDDRPRPRHALRSPRRRASRAMRNCREPRGAQGRDTCLRARRAACRRCRRTSRPDRRNAPSTRPARRRARRPRGRCRPTIAARPSRRTMRSP